MDDRELLELAAKAAGYVPFVWKQNACLVRDDVTGREFGWGPLTDDGDALRLAVKLRFSVEGYGCGCQVFSIDRKIYADEFDEDDEYAATRRAIVRAAAEIGLQHK